MSTSHGRAGGGSQFAGQDPPADLDRGPGLIMTFMVHQQQIPLLQCNTMQQLCFDGLQSHSVLMVSFQFTNTRGADLGMDVPNNIVRVPLVLREAGGSGLIRLPKLKPKPFP